METYTKEKAKEWLKMFPDWYAVACDKNGDCFWYKNKLRVGAERFFPEYYSDRTVYGTLGKFTFDGDWKDTLVTRDDLVEYWEPKVGETYFILSLDGVRRRQWDCCTFEREALRDNLIFRTEEAAKNALAEIKRRSREDRKIVS